MGFSTQHYNEFLRLHSILVPTTTSLPTSTTYDAGTLQRLPLELRNKIYEHTFDLVAEDQKNQPDRTRRHQHSEFHCAPLQVETRFQGHDYTPFGPHNKQLPLCLQVNRQIVEEATKAIRHHILLTVENLSISSAKDLYCNLPPNMTLKQVRRMKITTPRVTHPFLPNLVAICPRLVELTVPIEDLTVAVTSDWLKTPAELSTTTGFGHLMRHKSLEKLNITCRAKCIGYNPCAPDVKMFQPLEKWLLAEARVVGKEIKLDIDLSPGVDGNWVENTRMREGCVKWVSQMDFFG